MHTNTTKFPMYLTIYENEYEDVFAQELKWDTPALGGKFRVANLYDCPEDATVNRDLFNAYDFIDAVRFGIELARKGYEDLEVTETHNYPANEQENW